MTISSPIYCLLSQGDLKFVPLDTTISVVENDEKLALNRVLETVTAASPLSSITTSPTPELLGSRNDNLLLSDEIAHSVYLPTSFLTLSAKNADENQVLKQELCAMFKIIFPSWSCQDIKIKQLTGGITNMLISVTNTITLETVLVRTYGQGTDMIIDRDREFVSQLFLSSKQLAAPIHARFGNGLVYGFLPGRAVSPEEMSDERLYPLIAQMLGHWHRVIKGDDINEGIVKLRELRESSSNSSNLIRDIWELISSWIQVLPEIQSLLDKCLQYRDLLELKESDLSLKDILNKELEWLLNNIAHKSPIVTSHSDLLSGNVIIPNELSKKLEEGSEFETDGTIEGNPVSFIDYEYMCQLPRGFDISNHFMEWQGFECDKSRIPEPSKSNPTMIKWATLYLSTGEREPSTSEVEALIEEIAIFYGLPGFFWGIWAGIQSTISIIEFDYKNYCCERLEEYFVWKRDYV